jgi:hypothetical protein
LEPPSDIAAIMPKLASQGDGNNAPRGAQPSGTTTQKSGGAASDAKTGTGNQRPANNSSRT